jgi:hypothetical protein
VITVLKLRVLDDKIWNGGNDDTGGRDDTGVSVVDLVVGWSV